MLSWQAQLEDAKKEIAELEDRISALREELRDAQWAADAARLQRILAVREQHLERAKFHAQFIESRIANGWRTVKPIPYSELASICFNGGTTDGEGRYRRDAEGTREDLFRQSNR